MVAYSFNPRFEDALREGWKTQTIRRKRDRHARPGEMIQLYIGMRTVHCRKAAPDVRCTGVDQIVITFGEDGGIDGITYGGWPVADLDAFARSDGFADSDDMAAFWRREHGPREVFHGVLIQWAPPRHPSTSIGE